MTFSKVPRWILRIVYGFARVWWMITQFFTRKPKYPMPVLTSIDSIIQFLNYGNSWTPDPLKGRWDVMFHATHSVKRLVTENEKMSMDCEDHACVWASALTENKIARSVALGAIWFVDPDGVASGHVVCLFQDFNGSWFWCDYGTPRAFTEQWDWAQQAAAGYRGKLIYCAKFDVKGVTSRGLVRIGAPDVHKVSS